ncbi:MAG: alpha/beta hydrolase family protein, partial [Pseudonocardia sp.]
MDARRPLLLIVLLSLVACTQSVESQPNQRPQAAGSATSAAPSASTTPTPTPATRQTPPLESPERVNPVSLPALMQKKYDGRALRLGEVIVQTDAYTQRFATFKSGALTISGIMNVPSGEGRFPVLVLAHGYIDPDIYVNGQGLRREQDWLARAGFAVLHVDYRGHASSDDGRDTEERLRLGYTEDVINAVHAIRKSRLPFLDKERVGLLGRSMGGGVAYNVLVSA